MHCRARELHVHMPTIQALLSDIATSDLALIGHEKGHNVLLPDTRYRGRKVIVV